MQEIKMLFYLPVELIESLYHQIDTRLAPSDMLI